MEEPARPEPDALLAEASREGRGRLKVYLGMAPGVGKTYAMLEGARRLKAQGLDVAIGVVETHGRTETEALLEGLEILPRRLISYRGVELAEFDIDAALARRPRLLLVDEFAHTNADGSRHPKRWQDALELIRAGIEVHTTLNVQHLESLNDVVARITGVRMQEVVPDKVLDAADDIEIVDLTPQELIERLEAGKVYVAHLAGRARESYFRPGNLSALRELALRRTADRVDEQMRGYMRSRAIEGPWPVTERLMICVGPDGLGPSVVRAGHRLAEQLKAPWTALFVERTGAAGSNEASVIEALTLAERLGGPAERLTGTDLPGEILRHAKRNNVTQIVIGQSRATWLKDVLGRSLVQALVRRSEGVSVHVVTLQRKPAAMSPVRFALPRPPAYAVAIAGVAAVVGLTFANPDKRTQPNASMLFIAAVLLSAVRDGHIAGLMTAVLSFAAYNFFFTEPYFTFNVRHWQDVVTLLVFLIVAAITGTLAGRVRDQIDAARSRMNTLQFFYDFSRRLGAAKTADELLHAVVLQTHRLAGLPGMMLLPGPDDLTIRYAWPPEDALENASWAAARWALRHAEPAGAGTETLPNASWQFRPMRTGKAAVGILGLRSEGKPLSGELIQTLDAMLDQAAVAIERINFADEISHAKTMMETERFRNVLLSSISHDLRTPLTSILGSVTALRDNPAQYSERSRDDLLATIQEESERLDRFVANLLDITRLESGILDVKHDFVLISEVIDSASKRIEHQLGGKRLIRTLDARASFLQGDFVLLDTVLVNLLDNAAKHAAGASTIEIGTRAENGEMLIDVVDDGVGIPPEYLPRLFDKFFRIHRADTTVAGTGLGLSICKGLVEAMGGRIEVQSPVKNARGTRFTVRLPLGSQPVQTPELSGVS
jgi:two-component system sensor histidine kinase KdpD